MKIPSDWITIVILALAAWRIFNLIAYDAILDWPRRRLLRLDPSWQKAGDDVGEDYRLKWAIFITCPYCAGFWIGSTWFLAWQISPFWVTFVAFFFALNVPVIALAKILTPEDDSKDDSKK